MNFVLRVSRAENATAVPYRQEFDYEGNPDDSIAAALRALNDRVQLLDRSGNAAAPIRWECGCCAGKCGACAMVINGVPRLACQSFFRDLGAVVTLEPLHKFPLVADLIVDRSAVLANLKKMSLWLASAARTDEKDAPLRFAAAACLQCGCCLEVCPNFRTNSEFSGAAAAVAAFLLLNEESEATHRSELAHAYIKNYYNGCGLSLACRDVCPAGLPLDELLSRGNAAAAWKRKL